MQLTKHTDYAIRVLIYLQKRYLETQDGKASLVTATDIASVFNISFNHLTKVVQHLGQAGFIETIRGKNGGVKLARAAHLINLGEVVFAMEKSLAPVNCAEPPCRLRSACLVKPILDKAMNAFIEELKKYTLLDICIEEDNDVWQLKLP